MAAYTAQKVITSLAVAGTQDESSLRPSPWQWYLKRCERRLDLVNGEVEVALERPAGSGRDRRVARPAWRQRGTGPAAVVRARWRAVRAGQLVGARGAGRGH